MVKTPGSIPVSYTHLLGTKVYVEFPGKWAHLSGYYTAEDTGGAIKGKIIDVFIDTDDESVAARCV